MRKQITIMATKFRPDYSYSHRNEDAIKNRKWLLMNLGKILIVGGIALIILTLAE